MNRRLFEDLIVSARGKRGGRGRFAVPASVGIHAAVIGGAVLLSALGPAELMPEVTARPMPPILAPVVLVAPHPVAIHDPTPRSPRMAHPSGGPPGVPRPAPVITDSPLTPGSTEDIVEPPPGCEGPGCDDGPPPLFPTVLGPRSDGADPSPPSLVRASVDVAPPVKLRNVDPVYPEPARRAGVAGVVIIECTIDPKGRIANARILRGHPLLDAAALDAVQQWVYTPSRLNGAPVSVVMTVTVHFKIAR